MKANTIIALGIAIMLDLLSVLVFTGFWIIAQFLLQLLGTAAIYLMTRNWLILAVLAPEMFPGISIIPFNTAAVILWDVGLVGGRGR